MTEFVTNESEYVFTQNSSFVVCEKFESRISFDSVMNTLNSTKERLQLAKAKSIANKMKKV